MNTSNPLVSIVIPSYNHARFVSEAIQSVINQNYDNIELIVIDDGSTDESVKIIQEMSSFCINRFKRFEFRHRENKGLSATLNEAIDWCQGEFIGCVASDDILKPQKTCIQVDYLEKNPDSIGVFGGVEVFDDTYIREVTVNHTKYTFDEILLHFHSLPAPTQLLRLRSVKSVGGYNENVKVEDWYMWLKLTRDGGTLDVLSDVLAAYRRHDTNTSVNYALMYQGRKQVVNFYNDNKLFNLANVYIDLIRILETNQGTIKKLMQFLIYFATNPLLTIIYIKKRVERKF